MYSFNLRWLHESWRKHVLGSPSPGWYLLCDVQMTKLGESGVKNISQKPALKVVKVSIPSVPGSNSWHLKYPLVLSTEWFYSALEFYILHLEISRRITEERFFVPLEVWHMSTIWGSSRTNWVFYFFLFLIYKVPKHKLPTVFSVRALPLLLHAFSGQISLQTPQLKSLCWRKLA